MFSARLKQLRLARGLSLDELSALMGGIVTKQALSKYETGKANPSPIVLSKLASTLKVKSAYFLTEPSWSITFAFRKRASLSKGEMSRVQNLVAEALEERLRMQELTLQKSYLATEEIGVGTVEESETAAETIRKRWNLGTEPISSVVDTLESHLIHVLQISAHERFDGIAAIAQAEGENEIKAAMVVTREGVSGERQRLSLTHELGHVILKPKRNLDPEAMAYRFGGAMLAPAEILKREVGPHRSAIGIEELLILKQRFGISIQALLRRLRDLDIISASYYKDWCVEINRLGWKKQEPKQMNPEEPTWLRKTVYRAFAEGLIGSEDFERMLGEIVPKREFLSLAQKRAFLKLPLAERRQLLEQQAEKMAIYYREHPDYFEDDADEDY